MYVAIANDLFHSMKGSSYSVVVSNLVKLDSSELCAICIQAKCSYAINSKVHKKFINECVFIYHFESSQICEHFSQHGNTGYRPDPLSSRALKGLDAPD